MASSNGAKMLEDMQAQGTEGSDSSPANLRMRFPGFRRASTLLLLQGGSSHSLQLPGPTHLQWLEEGWQRVRPPGSGGSSLDSLPT